METTEKKEFKIIVNTREKAWNKAKISYEEVVVLAFSSVEEGVTYTIDYSKGPKENPEGSLTKGESVEVKDEMIFNVTKTNKS
jgi:hypothetical protein